MEIEVSAQIDTLDLHYEIDKRIDELTDDAIFVDIVERIVANYMVNKFKHC